MSHTLDYDFSQNQVRRWKKINKDQLLNQGHSACFFFSVLIPHLFSFFGKHPFWMTSLDHYHNPLSQFKVKTPKLVFLVYSRLSLSLFFNSRYFYFLSGFLQVLRAFGDEIWKESSVQYRVTFHPSQSRGGKKPLETARNKPKGVWAGGGHKGHFVFSHSPLSIIAAFLSFISLCSRPSAVPVFLPYFPC